VVNAVFLVLFVGVVIVVYLSWRGSGEADPGSAPKMPSPAPDGVTGYAFSDVDGDGEFSDGDRLLAGWTVDLYSTGTLPIATRQTGADGEFAFPHVKHLADGVTSVALQVTPVMQGDAGRDLPDPTALSQRFTVELGGVIAMPVTSFDECDTACDVQLPDLVPLMTQHGGDDYPPPTQTVVDTTTMPGHTLLRFASSTANVGGLLHVVSTGGDEASLTAEVAQRIYGERQVEIVDSGEFVYHPQHKHIHVDDFERYDLLAPDGTVLRTSGKVSFCLTDVVAYSQVERRDGDVFLDLPPFDCGVVEQGINTGYADYYGRDLPDQWIDTTSLPSGRYWVRITVDPSGVIRESDTTNNTARFRVDYVAPTGPPASE